MTHDYDAIVVGVGAMGSAATYHLARRGERVLGLERYDIPHARGSSHGVTRIIRKAYYEHPDYVPLLERAYENWRDLDAGHPTDLLHTTGLVMAGPPGSDKVADAVAWRLALHLPDAVLAVEIGSGGHAAVVTRALRVRARSRERRLAPGVRVPRRHVRRDRRLLHLDRDDALVVDAAVQRLPALAYVRHPVALARREIQALPAVRTPLAGLGLAPVDELHPRLRQPSPHERDRRHASALVVGVVKAPAPEVASSVPVHERGAAGR